jgi:alpha-glucosidase (family GH31 glycosyl hydrolase)
VNGKQLINVDLTNYGLKQYEMNIALSEAGIAKVHIQEVSEVRGSRFRIIDHKIVTMPGPLVKQEDIRIERTSNNIVVIGYKAQVKLPDSKEKQRIVHENHELHIENRESNGFQMIFLLNGKEAMRINKNNLLSIER